MADELKDQRIPIMMTPSEVKAVEDWMFENRIRSRADAIRRLVTEGFTTDYLKNYIDACESFITEILSGNLNQETYMKWLKANQKHTKDIHKESKLYANIIKDQKEILNQILKSPNVTDEDKKEIREALEDNSVTPLVEKYLAMKIENPTN